MTAKKTPDTISAVRFSRVLRLRWVVAVGASISIGLGIFTLLGVYIQTAGLQALGVPFLILAILTLPLILTYVERMAVIPGAGGPYALAKASGIVWLMFVAGWLLLGGYISLIALLGWGIALHFNLVITFLFEQPLHLNLVAAAVIALIALYNILGTTRIKKSKSGYIFAGAIFLALLILFDIIALPPTATNIYWSRSSSGALSVTALMSAGLWGLYFVFNIRDEIHRPTKTLLQAALLLSGLTVGLGLLAGIAIAASGIRPTTLTPLLEISTGAGFLPEGIVLTTYAAFGIITILIALNHTLVHALSLLGVMTREGLLPKEMQLVSKRYKVPAIALAVVSLLSIILVVASSTVNIAGMAALVFLWVAALVHIPDSFSAKPNLPKKRRPKLPFHPLFPWLTMAIGIFLSFNLPFSVLWIGLAWLLSGGGFYLLYARQKGLDTRRREAVIGEAVLARPQTDLGYTVLVGIGNPLKAQSLLEAGSRLARAGKGRLLVLKVVSLAEHIPNHLKRQTAQKEWEALDSFVRQAEVEDVQVKSLVRLAPTPRSGILETVKEEGVDLLLLGWEKDSHPDDIPYTPTVNWLIKRAGCDIAILHGPFPEQIEKILAPTAGGPHAPAAAALAQKLLDSAAGQILVETLVTEKLTPALETQANADLDAASANIDAPHTIERRIVEVENVKRRILDEAESADLLLLGASKQGILENSYFGGLPVEIAEASSKPTMLVRRQESISQFSWRGLYETLVDWLPQLTAARQGDVYQSMHAAAQPSVDFFVLITLSATIATLGLLQNSAAVIIGAMLVAPLMSPILAMAMSMVHGNLRLLLVAAEATSKGAALAILVGMVVTLISPISGATNEILARTEPNILDLMIALASGAAAGYSISRKEVSAALPGVAIAVALVPPLGVVGYGLGTSQLGIATGALLLFLTNLIAIIFSSSLTFLALGFQPQRAERGELMRGLQITVISLVVIAVVLAFTTVITVVQSSRQKRVEAIFTSEIVKNAGEVLEFTISNRRRNDFEIEAMVISYEDVVLTAEELALLEAELSEAVGGNVTVQMTVVSGLQEDLAEAAVALQIQELFYEKIAPLPINVVALTADKSGDGYLLSTTIISLEKNDQFDSAMRDIQSQISAEIGAPLTINATILFGEQTEFEPANDSP